MDFHRLFSHAIIGMDALVNFIFTRIVQILTCQTLFQSPFLYIQPPAMGLTSLEISYSEAAGQILVNNVLDNVHMVTRRTNRFLLFSLQCFNYWLCFSPKMKL